MACLPPFFSARGETTLRLVSQLVTYCVQEARLLLRSNVDDMMEGGLSSTQCCNAVFAWYMTPVLSLSIRYWQCVPTVLTRDAWFGGCFSQTSDATIDLTRQFPNLSRLHGIFVSTVSQPPCRWATRWLSLSSVAFHASQHRKTLDQPIE